MIFKRNHTFKWLRKSLRKVLYSSIMRLKNKATNYLLLLQSNCLKSCLIVKTLLKQYKGM